MEDKLAPPGRMKYYEGMDLINHHSFELSLSPFILFVGVYWPVFCSFYRDLVSKRMKKLSQKPLLTYRKKSRQKVTEILASD